MIPGPAAAAALLAPRSIAIIGDTPTSGRGGLLHEQLVRRGYRGHIVPVNPKYTEIRGLPAYPSLAAYGGEVDFVAVTLGAPQAVASMQDCARAAARAVLFIGSGFAEVGGEGATIQRELQRIAEANGIALAGPNCYGLANVRGGFAPFFGALPEPLTPGPVALISGSGALTHAVGDVLASRGTGFGYVITVGNEAGVDAADYLSLVADDPDVRVIACYLETIRDAQRFGSAVRKASAAGKRVAALTVGRSAAARRASTAHTGALAGEARVVEAFLDRLGVIVVHDLDELIETVELAAHLPRIGGGSLAVMTISGGGGAVLADLAADARLELTQFCAPTLAALRRAIPGHATLGNPVDLTGLATDDPAILADALRAVDREPVSDTGLHLFAINTPQGAGEADRALYRRMLTTIIQTAPELRSPVALLTLTSGTLDPVLLASAHDAGIPVLQGARESLIAVARLRAASAAPTVPVLETGRASSARARAARKLLAAARRSTLTQSEAADIVRALGIDTATGQLVQSPEAAIAVAEQLGYPVVAKIESPDIVHKTDAGCVLLNLREPQAVRAAVVTILDRATRQGAQIDGVRIEKQIPDGVAVLLGVTVDPQLGPAVVIGAGGIYTELLDDVAILPAPTTEAEVRATLPRLRVHRLLRGARGHPPADVDALVAATVALSEFAQEARSDIAAIDLNPVIVHAAGNGATAVDAVLLRAPDAIVPASEDEPQKERA